MYYRMCSLTTECVLLLYSYIYLGGGIAFTATQSTHLITTTLLSSCTLLLTREPLE